MITFIKDYIKCIMNPPLNITGSVPKGTKCEFCRNEKGLTLYSNIDFCICHECVAKSHRLILKSEKSETTND